MIRIAICDDNNSDRKYLYDLLCKCGKKLFVQWDIRIFESGEAFLESEYRADILFLDIVMKQKDGIQVGAEIRKQKLNTIIIYVTNVNEKMQKAINCIHSYGYFLKPIKEEELFQIMQEAINELESSLKTNHESFLLEKNGLVNVSVMDIYYFEYCDRKVKLVTKEADYIIKEKIGDIAKRMKCYNFEMSHQSFVVNLYEVEKINGQYLEMKNGELVCLAQKRASTIRSRIMEIPKTGKQQ